MNVILLAAGLGTRLLPLTAVLPKCLMPIHGRPQLEYWLRALSQTQGAFEADIVVNTHYLPELVREYLEHSPWDGRVRLVHEAELLGTGGTLLANSFPSGGPVMLVHADNLCSADLQAFMAAHANRSPGTVMTMMSFRTDAPKTCGILDLDKRGVVRAFHEKVADPPGNLANAAVYIVEPEVTAYIAGLGRRVVDFSTEVIPHFLGRIQSWENDGYHRDIGNVDSFLAAQEEFPVPESNPVVEPDGWLRLCRKDGGALPRAFAKALAQALDLPMVKGNVTPPKDPVLLLLPDDRSLLDRAAGRRQFALASGSIIAIEYSAGESAQTALPLYAWGWQVITICAVTKERL
ncbi:MAG: nucleotidyltransferase family protein [Proteobacteria bacterium]|nr:nucleotidyltransferase family protein [Pseudomonadota bacterium]